MSSSHSPSKLHRGSTSWQNEVELTSSIPKSEDGLLNRIHTRFPLTANKISQTGRRMDHMQIQYVEPWEVTSEFPSLNVTRVKFHIYHPITKKPGSIDMRISDDTGVLMVLVLSPKSEGGYDRFLVARRKFQPGANWGKITEFERGYTPGKSGDDIGWELFRRFPGLENNDNIAKVWHTQLGDEVYENTGEMFGKTNHHLVVVTLAKPMSKDELQSYLTIKKLEDEYADRRDQYPNLSELTEEDLVSAPVVMTLREAADQLNAHLNGNGKPWIFGEFFSKSVWCVFITIFHEQFAEYLPQSRVIPEL